MRSVGARFGLGWVRFRFTILKIVFYFLILFTLVFDAQPHSLPSELVECLNLYLLNPRCHLTHTTPWALRWRYREHFTSVALRILQNLGQAVCTCLLTHVAQYYWWRWIFNVAKKSETSSATLSIVWNSKLYFILFNFFVFLFFQSIFFFKVCHECQIVVY